MGVTNYNIRVYGLLLYGGKVLLSHENRGGMMMTKFPGGGHEKGEGLAECVIREFQEELGITITVKELFYVNDFVQISRFNPADQLISFYYVVETIYPEKINTVSYNPLLKPEEQEFEWRPAEQLQQDDFTFPIDRLVAEKLKMVKSGTSS